jgi:polysaccharide biosynthesis PFTS motif protein
LKINTGILTNIPIITRFISRRRRCKLRLINKGYRKLKDKDELIVLSQLKDALSKTQLNNSSLLKIPVYQDSFNVELSIRQYFYTRLLGLSFNESFLYSIGSEKSFKHPLPKEWRVILTGRGISVDNFSCAVLWRVRSFIIWGYETLQGLKSIYLLFKKQPCLERYTYFDGLHSNNISNNPDAHNILNWYLRWRDENIEINSICHGVNGIRDFSLKKVYVVKTDGLPQLKNLSLFKYIAFFVYVSIYSFVCLFFKPVYGLLLGEVIKIKRVELARDVDLARDYLFHNSSPYYRPIWTYLAEEKGSRILFYFYAAHSDYFYRTYIKESKIKDGHLTGAPWHLMSWPYYLVWNKFHVNLIKKFDQHNSIIEDVAPIWFSSNNVNVNVPLNSIAVFDVTPFNTSFYITLGLSLDYYIPNIANHFLNDIQKILAQKGYVMAHKMKRICDNVHKKYSHNIKMIEVKSNYQQIHPNSDATQLIQKTIATISIPFTSTALIAKYEGKPSVYYDPTGLIDRNDVAAQGIQVLIGIDELREWCKDLESK